jgi:hypothetical protein
MIQKSTGQEALRLFVDKIMDRIERFEHDIRDGCPFGKSLKDLFELEREIVKSKLDTLDNSFKTATEDLYPKAKEEIMKSIHIAEGARSEVNRILEMLGDLIKKQSADKAEIHKKIDDLSAKMFKMIFGSNTIAGLLIVIIFFLVKHFFK